MRDLSVLIPAREEQFLPNTINDILENREADTEVIVVLDGYKPHFGRRQERLWNESGRVTLIHVEEPVGQRGGVNLAARHSNSKYVMKLDAHSAVDKGFDVKLMSDCEPNWTVIPRMYNLHVFDWECIQCGDRYYQADPVPTCTKCSGNEFKQTIVWKPRIKMRTDFARFDNTMHFQYWRGYDKRPEAKGDIADLMSSVGACFFMHRDRFYALEGLDEKTGFWGQFGTEISCKSWLSGGRQVVNKNTWYSHFFRVGKLKFPYQISGNQQDRAREYSRDIWFGNKWPKQVLPLSWLVKKFWPVKDWTDMDLERISQVGLINGCN